jgi:hypothetical protein
MNAWPLRLVFLTAFLMFTVLGWGFSTSAQEEAPEPADAAQAEENRADSNQANAEPARPDVAGVAAATEPRETTDVDAETAEGLALFREKILPVLEDKCYQCHSARGEKVESGFRLDSRDGIRRGGDIGVGVVPKNPVASLLLSAIEHDDLEMPPEGDKLPDAVIADFRRWIELGAPDPREVAAAAVSRFDFEQERGFWVFQPIERAEPPVVRQTEWPTNWIDNFILAKLEAEGLAPAPAASKEELVRRVYFDVTGLPPTPAEVDAFVNDNSPTAYEDLVERLLASPRYGERAGQHWLDVVRFAESEGFEYDNHVPDAWRYRDYVIQSFNEDKPYSQFVLEQIAGDELASEELNEQDIEYLTAAAFHRLGAVRRNAGNQEVSASRNEVLTERTDIIGAAFLGLTIGCARCHDHKFDAILQKDYYRIQAYLAATEENNVSLIPAGEAATIQRESRQLQQQLRTLRREARLLEGDELAEAERRIAELEAQVPPPPGTAPSVANVPESRTDIHVLTRGEWEKKEDQVGPRGMSIIMGPETPDLPPDVAQPRTQLANWLTDDARMVTTRVFVNRIWQNYLGMGIVPTANNFGKNGELPSHRELLDALADEFIQAEQRPKAIARLILLSSTYRQSSKSPLAEAATVKDPENHWLWKFNRRRLSAEEIRDSMLAVSGRLNVKAGGPSVIVPVEQELVSLLYKPNQWQVNSDAGEHDRRSIYLISKRNLRLPFMEVFDQPIAQISCPIRETSTHAPQALELLNGTLSNQLAASFAERLTSEAGEQAEEQVRLAYRLATGRSPSESEEAVALEFLKENTLREFALAVLNLNGFLYVN